MKGLQLWMQDLIASFGSQPERLMTSTDFVTGGLFLESGSVPSSMASFVSLHTAGSIVSISCSSSSRRRTRRQRGGGGFLSVKDGGSGGERFVGESGVILENENENEIGEKCLKEEEIKVQNQGGALNNTQHLWAGAIAAMISRTFVAPLERLKLEYMVRGEQKHLIELIQSIAASQVVKGLKAFGKETLSIFLGRPHLRPSTFTLMINTEVNF